jgi:PAS domain S-box-containing protein
MRLREQPYLEKLYRILVENVRDYAIFALDPRGYIASWNEGARLLKRYEAPDIIGKHFSIFYPPEDVAAGKPAFELVEAVRVGRFEDEGWRVRADGTRFWANVIITALHDENAELIGFAKITRDLTERREAELRNIEQARQLAATEAASRAKSEFLATLSHELRTPLNAIGGYAELLQLGLRGSITDGQRSDLERIRRSQQHLLALINDLLNFSRLEAGGVSYDEKPIALDDAAENVVTMLLPQAASKSLTLEYKPAAESVVALADQPKVEQILLNLVSNAVKFTESGGRITVWSERGAHDVKVFVRDTGPGIEPEAHEDIFEPFVQLGRTLTSSQEGTGLGLAISRQLARAMKGDLTVESAPGTGSTFTLSLPSATLPVS